MEILIIEDGGTLRGYDCREILGVEEAEPGKGDSGGFRIVLGRGKGRRALLCRRIVGCVDLSARDIRPVPRVLGERLSGERPWAVGLTDRGPCLLY